MSKTKQFKLPLIQSAQAQKHITVNESLSRLDALSQLRLLSISTVTPPDTVQDGAAYYVPMEASGEWQPLIGTIAIYANGGWVRVVPLMGWQAWVEDVNARYIFLDGAWQAESQNNSVISIASGAASTHNIYQIKHRITEGTTSITSAIIPSHNIVYALTGRVIEVIETSHDTTWRLGVQGSYNRYGQNYGLAQNSYAIGITSQPLAYYENTPLYITLANGRFISGIIRLCVHAVSFTPPNSV